MNNHSLNDKRILVTGGAGFIASHLVECLVRDGARVTVIENFGTGHESNLAAVRPDIDLIIGDMFDVLRLRRVDLAEFDTIFHMAANPYIPPSVENPAFDFHENLENSFALLEGLRKIQSRAVLVNISSAAVYGNPERLPICETDPTVPISPYGVSKLAAERYAAVYSQIYDLRTVSLRFFSVYGPRQRKQVIFDLYRKLRTDPHHLEIYGDGTQMRDFVHVQDIVQALILAATRAPARGEAYNVAQGTSVSIADVAAMWCRVLNLQPEITYTQAVRPGDAEKWEVDLSQIRALGFAPQVTLEAGLASIRDWYDATFG
jgi:UDP-glucose 4-epimerase